MNGISVVVGEDLIFYRTRQLVLHRYQLTQKTQ